MSHHPNGFREAIKDLPHMEHLGDFTPVGRPENQRTNKSSGLRHNYGPTHTNIEHVTTIHHIAWCLIDL